MWKFNKPKPAGDLIIRLGIPILMYHRVGPLDGSPMDRYTVSPSRFEAQMKYIATSEWNVIPLDALFDKSILKSAGKSVIVTFDDGYASNMHYAWPVLEKYQMPSTNYIVTEDLGETISWDGVLMPGYPVLTESDLRSANSSLMTFQSHTNSHPLLSELSTDEIERELLESKQKIESLTGMAVNSFAYPFGAWNKVVKHAVHKAGYKAACSCQQGLNRNGTDPLLLRRVEILDSDTNYRLHIKLVTGLNFSGVGSTLMSRVQRVFSRLARD